VLRIFGRRIFIDMIETFRLARSEGLSLAHSHPSRRVPVRDGDLLALRAHHGRVSIGGGALACVRERRTLSGRIPRGRLRKCAPQFIGHGEIRALPIVNPGLAMGGKKCRRGRDSGGVGRGGARDQGHTYGGSSFCLRRARTRECPRGGILSSPFARFPKRSVFLVDGDELAELLAPEPIALGFRKVGVPNQKCIAIPRDGTLE
jgi:hypothetical protein